MPAIYLHIEYYLRNRNERLEILDNRILYHDRTGVVKSYATQDLERIVLYMSASLDKGNIQFTPIESYHFAKIRSKSGQEIVVTCLMTRDLEKAMKMIGGVMLERKKTFFARTIL